MRFGAFANYLVSKRRNANRLGIKRLKITYTMLTPSCPMFFILVVLGLLGINVSGSAACNIVGGKAYGDCAGVSVNEGTIGHLTVRARTSEAAIIDGAIILKGGALDLSGISNGDITVHRGGHLRLTGVVNGTVNNLGGSVEVEGVLNHLHTTGGKVIIGGNVGSISGEGVVSYKKGAVIGGVPLNRSVRKGGKQ
jgi:hypothetical protein